MLHVNMHQIFLDCRQAILWFPVVLLKEFPVALMKPFMCNSPQFIEATSWIMCLLCMIKTDVTLRYVTLLTNCLTAYLWGVVSKKRPLKLIITYFRAKCRRNLWRSLVQLFNPGVCACTDHNPPYYVWQRETRVRQVICPPPPVRSGGVHMAHQHIST